MRQGKIAAIIPCRKGSQRVPLKNIRKFCDTNLLDHKIKQLKEIEIIDEIILTTDCEISKKIGMKYGITIIDRSGYYASSDCNNGDFFKYIATQVPEDKGIEYLIYTPVTSPFIKTKTIINVINKFMEDDSYDSVVPVEVLKHHMWMNGKPLNYEINNIPNTQDLPDIHALNYACSIISRKDQIKYSNLCGKNPYFYKLEQIETIDIDTIYDFEMAQLIYKSSMR